MLPLTSILTPVSAGAVSNASPTNIYTDIDADGWEGITIEVDLLTGTALTRFQLSHKQTSGGTYVASHGVGSYINATTGDVIFDGYLLSINSPVDPNVLAAGSTCSMRIKVKGLRYWRLALQSSSAGTANVRVTLWR